MNKALIADLGTARLEEYIAEEERKKRSTSRGGSAADQMPMGITHPNEKEKHRQTKSIFEDEAFASPWSAPKSAPKSAEKINPLMHDCLPTSTGKGEQQGPEIKDQDDNFVASLKTNMVGTPMFMAPEQVGSDGAYSLPVDVWAYGITLVRMFTLEYPYQKGLRMPELMRGIADGTLQPKRIQKNEVPHVEICNMINSCLEVDPYKRPTFVAIEKLLWKIKKELARSESSHMDINEEFNEE